MGTLDAPVNNSKSCGAVMRMAPIGLMYSNNPEMAFDIGMKCGVMTHGNPTAYLPAGVFACIVAHATLLFNVLLLPLFGKVKIDFWQNMKNMTVSVVLMYVIGLYCNLVFRVLVSPEKAYDVNSMFIIHSPFEGVDFLKYPIIALIALVLYFILFTVCDIIKHKKGERWFDKLGTLSGKRTASK